MDEAKKEYYNMFKRLCIKYSDQRASYYLAWQSVEKWHFHKYKCKMYSSYASFRVAKKKFIR